MQSSESIDELKAWNNSSQAVLFTKSELSLELNHAIQLSILVSFVVPVLVLTVEVDIVIDVSVFVYFNLLLF